MTASNTLIWKQVLGLHWHAPGQKHWHASF
jgi:hypothetical protein